MYGFDSYEREERRAILNRIRSMLVRKFRLDTGHLQFDIDREYVKIFNRMNHEETLVRYGDGTHYSEVAEEIYERFKYSAPPRRRYEDDDRHSYRAMFDRFHGLGRPSYETRHGKDIMFKASVKQEMSVKKTEEPKEEQIANGFVIHKVKEFKM